MRINLNAFLLLSVLLCAPRPAQALLTCGGPLSGPVIINVTDLSFNTYTPASDSFASASISVQCGALGLSILPGFTVALTQMNGTNPGARYLLQSSTHLSYNLYTTNGYSMVWGDGSNGTVTQSYNALLTLGSVPFTAWGKLPSGQYVTPGYYSDRITVTVSY